MANCESPSLSSSSTDAAVRKLLAEALEDASKDLRQLSLTIHGNPELSLHEVEAHRNITAFLEARGFRVEREAFSLKTAFRAVAESPDSSNNGSGSGVPVISFLSEYDALPNIGHACGHNLIAIAGIAGALATRKVLHDLKIPGKVVIFGTPAEETVGGKITMIKEEAFKTSSVALMLHPGNVNIVYAKYLAMVECSLEYRGKSAHASAEPWAGVNALDAMNLAFVAIGFLRQQIPTTARIHGIITHGGDAPNIIPEVTRAKFYIRGKTLKEMEDLRKRVIGCFEAGRVGTGCEMALKWEEPFADVRNNQLLAETYAQELTLMGSAFPDRHTQESTSRGSTDMGNVTYVVPGLHPVFDITPEGQKSCNIHTIEFEKIAATEHAHQATLTAAKALAFVGVKAARDPAYLASVWAEYRRDVHGL